MTNQDNALPAAIRFSELVTLSHLDTDVFISTHGGAHDPSPHTSHTVYGGQIAAQALRAAALTVAPDRAPHSMHCYFVAAGDPSRPVTFRVTRDRDGNGFSARRVTALQGDRTLCILSASFCTQREGLWRDQATAMPTSPDQHTSTPLQLGSLLSFIGRDTGIAPPDMIRPPRFWTRCTDELGSDPGLQACALLYVSDIAAGTPAASDGSAEPGASIDHAMWFHQCVDVDQWLLIDLTPVFTGRGRTYFTGQIFDEGGRLVASLSKEELFRSPTRS